jgi:hypothetical protein
LTTPYSNAKPVNDGSVPSKQPSPEYLAVIKELFKSGENDRLGDMQARLQHVLDEEGRRASNRGFSERYKSGEASLNVHWSGSLGIENRERREWCAVVNGLNASVQTGASSFKRLFVGEPSPHQVEVSVFVDVREFGQDAKVKSRSIVIVGLHSLNKCKHRCGNARQTPRELTLRERGNVVLWDSASQGELTMFSPVGINGGNSRIPLDKLECKMIQGGSNLVNCITSEDGNTNRRLLSDTGYGFAVRIADGFVRLSGGVFGDCILDGLNVYRCPDEFLPRRIETS